MCTITQATPLALNVLEMVTQPKKRYPNYYRKNHKMPYNEAQNRLFRAAEHNPKIAKAHGMSHETAKKLASEGVKHNPQTLAKALMRK
jgi:hypothetical protein